MATQNLSSISSALGAYTAQAQGVFGQGEQSAARQKPVNVETSQSSISSRERLSVVGQLRAGLDQVQVQARRLQDVAAFGAPQELQAAVRNFAQAINALNGTAAAARNAPNNPPEARQQAARVQEEMRRALQSSTPEDGQLLQNIGVTMQRDGTLAVNQARLDAALRENRAAVTQPVTDVATRVQSAAQRQMVELTSSSTLEPIIAQSGIPATPQRDTGESRLEVQRDTQRRQLAQQLAAGYVARNAVASYINVSLL